MRGDLLTPYSPRLDQIITTLAKQHGGIKPLARNTPGISAETIYRFLKIKRFISKRKLEALLEPTEISLEDFPWGHRKDFTPNKKSNSAKEPLKYINNILHKKCNGPLHQGKFIPTTEFYAHKTPRHDRGLFRSRCKSCEMRARGYGGKMVPRHDVDFIFVELTRRLGKAETARRCGISTSCLRGVLLGKFTHVRYRIVERGIKTLKEVRDNDEIRHRDSIINGAAMRGLPEKQVRTAKDYYNRHGDRDAAHKRESRKRLGTQR